MSRPGTTLSESDASNLQCTALGGDQNKVIERQRIILWGREGEEYIDIVGMKIMIYETHSVP